MGLNPKFKRRTHAKRRVAALKEARQDYVPDRYSNVPPSPEPHPVDASQRRADLALRWLIGFTVVRDDNLLERRYPVGREDSESRAALAELLFDEEVSPDILWTLASLIAPEGHELALADRRLDFVARNRGGVANPSNDLKMAMFIASEIRNGCSEADAIATAVEYFSKSERRIKKAWYANKRGLMISASGE